MATRRKNGKQGESGEVICVTASRVEAIEILAAAVLELQLKRASGPSPDGPPRPRSALDSATSGQIRGPQ
jgi:hypothetical protein